MNVLERTAKTFLGDNAQPLRQVYRTVKSRIKWARRGYPTDAIIELTSRCNAECRFCPRMDLILDGEMTIGSMSGFTLNKLVEDLKTLRSLRQIIFAGYGEPLLYPKLPEAIRKVRATFPYIKIRVVTNGIALTKNMAKRIIASHLDEMIISLNYWDSNSYRDQTRVNAFETVVNNIRTFLDLKGSNLPSTWLQIFSVDENCGLIPKFERYWSSYMSPIDKIFIQGFHSYGGEVETTKYVSPTLPNPRYPCLQLWQHILITHDGKVYPCCAGVTGICIGNLTKQSLHEIVKGQRLENFRRLHLTNRSEEIPACRECDFWARYKNPFVHIGDRWI